VIERNVKEKVKRIIKCYEARTRCLWWSYWPVQTGFGKHGIPDCLLCVQGQLVAIETKVDHKQPTVRQWHQLAEIENSQGISLVIDQYNLADIESVFNAIIHGNIHEARSRAKGSIAAFKARCI
jgi:hypothetical protein